MGVTIEELLKSMQKYEITIENKNMVNSKETWRKIGDKNDFSEFSFSSDEEKEAFLKEWIKDNPYSNTI